MQDKDLKLEETVASHTPGGACWGRFCCSRHVSQIALMLVSSFGSILFTTSVHGEVTSRGCTVSVSTFLQLCSSALCSLTPPPLTSSDSPPSLIPISLALLIVVISTCPCFCSFSQDTITDPEPDRVNLTGSGTEGGSFGTRSDVHASLVCYPNMPSTAISRLSIPGPSGFRGFL
jgi:hypothetical protein